MAKNMALLDDSVVVNMLWCSSNQPETDMLKDVGDRPVSIGDTYADGKWYRGGMEVLTPLESAFLEIERLRTENADMQSALEILEVKPDEEME